MRRLKGLFCLAFLLLMVSLSWAGGYGAIAYSESTGNWGTSYGHHSSQQAVDAAIQRCGQSDCRWKVWLHRSCGALAKGARGALGWSWNCGNRGVAQERALRACRRNGGENCQIVCWVCSGR